MFIYDDYKTFILEFDQENGSNNVLKDGVSTLDMNI